MHPSPKLAILATPGPYERYVHLSDFVATLRRRNLIDQEFYERIVSKDPILSLARQVHRVGTTEWARRIYQSGDTTVPVAAASKILGVEAGSGAPVLKREYGVDDRDLPGLVAEPELRRRGDARARAPSKPAPTMGDGVALHPNAIPVEGYTAPPRRGSRPDPAGATRPPRSLLPQAEAGTSRAERAGRVSARGHEEVRLRWRVSA